MKPLRGIALLVGCLLALILAACNDETATPTILDATATRQPYPAALSPTAALAPTAYPAPATETLAPMPNATSTPMPSPTEKLQPTPTLTPVSTPKVWGIWFSGSSCEGDAECGPAPGRKYSFFSILSDGSKLEMLNISALPVTPLPNWLPQKEGEEFLSQAYFSPDANWMAYLSRPFTTSLLTQMYLVNVKQQTVAIAHETPDQDGTRGYIGGICWSTDSRSIRFIETTRHGQTDSIPTIYRLDITTMQTGKIFALDELPRAWFGICSPDGKELMLVVSMGYDRNEKGLYLLNLDTLQWKQILKNYDIAGFQAAPSEYQP